MQAYNADVVLDLLTSEMAKRPRGAQTRLAEAVGVKVQTVNKWVKRQTCPEPDKWPAIEDYLGLDRGTLRAAVGLAPAEDQDDLRTQVAELRQQVAGLSAAVAALSQNVRQLDTPLDGARADGAARRSARPAR